jgi:PAS domain S-box-containing protein
LRVLIAEDNPTDAELVLRELRRSGFDPEWHRVDTEAEYLDRLHTGLDIILSDYEMPQFGGTRALELLQKNGMDVPFIIISGTIGEDTAVAAIKQGAADYLLKDRLTRLGPAVSQALEQARLRRERRQTEESLRQSEAEFRAMTEASPLGIFVADCKGLLTYTNTTLRQMLGVGFQEMAGTGWARSVHPLDRAELLAKWQEATAGKESLESSTRFVRPDGATIQTSIKTAVMRAQDSFLGYVGVVEDITERRQAEERVREQAAMLDRAHEAIIVRDLHTRRITFWNQGAERLYGWTAAEAEGIEIGDLIFADPDAPMALTEQLLQTGEWHGEHQHVSKAGKKLTVSSHVTLICDADDTPKSVLVINIDVTEQKALEARFLRAQRMESIGTLASGVAHDLNNILSPIMMSVPLLRRNISAAQRERTIAIIETSAERGAQIVRQVLTFGSGLEGEKRQMRVDVVIHELMKIMGETFPKNITLESSIEPELWQVIGDATQIHQVLLNLFVNARDAMPEGGRLRLRAANLKLDANYASMLPEATPGPYVLLEVSDTGSGIPPEIVERIFDPFFTTKGIGKGTGLGLSTVLGIVRSHGGIIHVSTQPAKGTSFDVYLPASPDQAASPADASHTPIPEGHGELVLVVDDEENVRVAAGMALETAGYNVLLAADGTEALAIFAMNSGRVAAMLTDLMMPFMDGAALIRALRTMVPALPIIASTGLGEKAQLAQLKAMGVETILHKPYGADTLLRAIHGTLHPTASSPTA